MDESGKENGSKEAEKHVPFSLLNATNPLMRMAEVSEESASTNAEKVTSMQVDFFSPE